MSKGGPHHAFNDGRCFTPFLLHLYLEYSKKNILVKLVPFVTQIRDIDPTKCFKNGHLHSCKPFVTHLGVGSVAPTHTQAEFHECTLQQDYSSFLTRPSLILHPQLRSRPLDSNRRTQIRHWIFMDLANFCILFPSGVDSLCLLGSSDARKCF